MASPVLIDASFIHVVDACGSDIAYVPTSLASLVVGIRKASSASMVAGTRRAPSSLVAPLIQVPPMSSMPAAPTLHMRRLHSFLCWLVLAELHHLWIVVPSLPRCLLARLPWYGCAVIAWNRLREEIADKEIFARNRR